MSKFKPNIWFDPLPKEFNEGPLVFVVQWTIPKENHDKLVDLVTGAVGNYGMDSQRILPLTHFYSRTRHWFKPNPDGATENWWFMDEYDSPEAFRAMQQQVQDNFKGSNVEKIEKQKERHQQLLDLMVEDTTLEPILYSEVTSARVEFEPFKIRKDTIERAKRFNESQSNKK